MNGVSGSGGSGQPYMPKDDDDKKKASLDTAKSGTPKIENPADHYSIKERAADLYDFCAINDAGPCNKDVAVFAKALAENHSDASTREKLIEAGREVVKHRALEFIEKGGGLAVEKLAHKAIKGGGPGVGIALEVLEKGAAVAEKGSAIFVKTDAGMKSTGAGQSKDVATSAVEKGVKEAAKQPVCPPQSAKTEKPPATKSPEKPKPAEASKAAAATPATTNAGAKPTASTPSVVGGVNAWFKQKTAGK